jgi:hypothetical protein
LSRYQRPLGVLAVLSCLGLPNALAAGDGWKFEIDKQDQPSLTYLDGSGKTVFQVGCGGHFNMWMVYPGALKKEGEKASVAIANKKTSMDFAGEIDGSYPSAPPNTIEFEQPDLGFARDDPELYEEKWHALEKQFFDLLDSGQPLTIAAEGHNYVLPAIKIAGWRKRFNKIC